MDPHRLYPGTEHFGECHNYARAGHHRRRAGRANCRPAGLFGLFSFLQAIVPLFKDPLVSILPRLFIGVTAWYSYAALRKNNEFVALVVAGVVGTLTNTVLVIGMAILRGYLTTEVIVAIAPQAIAEMIIAAVLVVAVVAAWKRIETGGGGSSV